MLFLTKRGIGLLVAVLAIAVSLSACTPPPSAKSVLEPDAEKSAPVVALEMPAARDEIPRAKRILSENYEAFLERQPLGFDQRTLERLGPEVQRAWRRTTRTVDVVGDSGVRNSAPLFVIGLFLIALALLDRQSFRVAVRVQATVRPVWWDWAVAWARLAIVVAGRCAPAAVLIGLSYFPIQAVFGRAGWSLALTSTLWLLLAYRALLTASQASLAFRLLKVADVHAYRLEAFARRTLRVIFVLLTMVVLAREIDVADDVRALLVFLYEGALLGVPLYLLFIKPSVMALFPEPDDSAIYARMRNGVERYYGAIIIISVMLLALRAIGYVNASTFILVRGYGLFLIIVLLLGGGTRLRRGVRARSREAGQERRDLYKSVEWGVQVVSVLFVLRAALGLLEVWEPMVVLLTIPLVSIGAAQISTYSILNAALLFLAAVLVARFVRAILVLRVFPAFGVDVGVGYAVQTLVNYALILIGFFIALIALGVNLSAMTVVLASLGVGIGFGLQTLTENLISGFILLFGRSVKKGDIITVGENYGQVQAVGARSVLIKTPDNYDLLIPSKEIVGGRIVNWSYENTLIRHKIPVGVTYNAKPREVEKILLAAAAMHPRVLQDPKPEVWLSGFGDNSVDFTLLVWFDCSEITRDRLSGQLYFHIWDGLEEAGIEIPFPQRDLHLKSIDFADELRKRL